MQHITFFIHKIYVYVRRYIYKGENTILKFETWNMYQRLWHFISALDFITPQQHNTQQNAQIRYVNFCIKFSGSQIRPRQTLGTTSFSTLVTLTWHLLKNMNLSNYKIYWITCPTFAKYWPSGQNTCPISSGFWVWIPLD